MHLSWILLVTAVCVACGATVPSTQWQFSQLITCTQPKVNPSIYNNYGCYCGVSGSGSPKDQIDQCCAVHDKCYENARKLPQCSPYAYQPFIKGYFFSCSAKTITCSVLNDKCQAAVCQCDRVAANCFAQYQNSYNSNYINLPTKACNIRDIEDIIFN